MNSRAIFLLAATIGTTLGFAPASQERATMIGTVVDAKSGAPLQFANVLLVGTALGATTGSDGSYKVEQVPAGNYAVRISRIGYSPTVIKRVRVSAAGPNVADVRLKVSTATIVDYVTTRLPEPGIGARAPFSTAVLRADEFGTLRLVFPKLY